MDLTINEKRVLAVLAKVSSIDAFILAEKLNAPVDAVVQWSHLCADRGLAVLAKNVTETAVLTAEGRQYAAEGLPERQVLLSMQGPTTMWELKKHQL